ncbi:hypothetical protein CMI39_01330 [Candidatus Pacearchaeota archaeon]|jgi:hypothetical protein|nr:hypothetical protein [Candidatus Pacearchaeota archaeon]|tara:strand:- start:6828 stop:7091 length:264 start_codon:yes stop_codon:yes gene_type:complete
MVVRRYRDLDKEISILENELKKAWEEKLETESYKLVNLRHKQGQYFQDELNEQLNKDDCPREIRIVHEGNFDQKYIGTKEYRIYVKA